MHIVLPAGVAKEQKVQNTCTCAARRAHCTPAHEIVRSQVHHAKVYPPAEFDVSGSKFPCIGGPHVKKVFRPWRVQPAPHRNGNHKSTHVEAAGRWGLLFGLQGWLKVCASLHAAAHATCHVRRAPLKSTKSRVRRMVPSTLKIWCECTAPFSRQTPESSTDRQTDRQRDDRKCQLIPPV